MTGRESLARAMAKFSPDVRTIANAALATLRARLPGATELVYDNYNGLVVGFSPTDRPYADVPFDAKRRRLEIRTVSARQRPRRPGTTAARSGRASRRPR